MNRTIAVVVMAVMLAGCSKPKPVVINVPDHSQEKGFRHLMASLTKTNVHTCETLDEYGNVCYTVKGEQKVCASLRDSAAELMAEYVDKHYAAVNGCDGCKLTFDKPVVGR